MINQNIRGETASVRRFHSIRSIEFHPGNILTSASFHPVAPRPLLQVLVDRLIEIIIHGGKP